MIQSLLAFFIFSASAHAYPSTQLLKTVDTCVKSESDRHLIIIKQWHLPPNSNAKETAGIYPQQKNQVEIYQELALWLQKKEVHYLIAEGCQKEEITEKSKLIFQGYGMDDLLKITKTKAYENVLAHPVLKLKAKFSKDTEAYCGDDLVEIKKAQMALSDARGDVGYLSRLIEYKTNPEKAKTYREGAIEILKLKNTASNEEILAGLTLDLKHSLKAFDDANHARNLSFIHEFESMKSKKPAVLVVGGLHASDLKKILEEKKYNCVILEPKSYQNDEESMSEALRKSVEKL